MNMIYSLSVAVLLLALYLYMYGRMRTMVADQSSGKYIPNMNRSLAELSVFSLIYFGCSVLIILPEVNIAFSIVITAGAFVLSLLVFNRLIFIKFGWFVVLFATAVVYGFYVLSAYLYLGSL